MASELIFYRVNHLNQTLRQQEKKHVGAFPTDLSWIVSGGRAEPTNLTKILRVSLWHTSNRLDMKCFWWTCRDLNSGPLPCQGSDLPTDLRAQWVA